MRFGHVLVLMSGALIAVRNKNAYNYVKYSLESGAEEYRT